MHIKTDEDTHYASMQVLLYKAKRNKVYNTTKFFKMHDVQNMKNILNSMKSPKLVGQFRDSYFFKLTQLLTVLLYTVKEKEGKPDRKPHTLSFGLRNPYRNLKYENSQDYAQKPQRNCTCMNSASVAGLGVTTVG
jgi:hypothetical protein